MNLHTFIFIGRSGCGKGTQAKLLDEQLKKIDPGTPIYHLETGARFRAFVAEDSYTSALAKKMMLEGKRQPDFLAVWMWSHHFVEDFTGKEHLVIDGTPRSLNEAKILDGGMKFYDRAKPFIVHLNVSREWSEKHLMARGRGDDDREGIKHRLDWYEADVQPAVEYYRNNPDYVFLDISGEQPVEAVHTELIEKTGFSG
jgi:adenylate kinase